jgi:hypothetical protein
LILKRVATLEELQTFWSIDDVADAIDAIDAMARAEAEAQQAQRG